MFENQMIRMTVIFIVCVFVLSVIVFWAQKNLLRAGERRDVSPEKIVLSNSAIVAPAAGNPDGDVTIIEFFDYGCGACKEAHPIIKKLVETDGNIRWEFRDLPVAGDDSFSAALVALSIAKNLPEKYLDFHEKMIRTNGPPSKENTRAILKNLNISERFIENGFWSKNALWGDRVLEFTLSRHTTLADSIGIMSVPAVIIENDVFAELQGGVDSRAIHAAIQKARQRAAAKQNN